MLGPSRGLNQPYTAGPPQGAKKLAHSGSSDEDPYSLTPSGSSGSSGKGPRGAEVGRKEREYYGPQNWAVKGGINYLSDEYVEVIINYCPFSEECPPPRYIFVDNLRFIP